MSINTFKWLKYYKILLKFTPIFLIIFIVFLIIAAILSKKRKTLKFILIFSITVSILVLSINVFVECSFRNSFSEMMEENLSMKMVSSKSEINANSLIDGKMLELEFIDDEYLRIYPIKVILNCNRGLLCYYTPTGVNGVYKKYMVKWAFNENEVEISKSS